MPYEDPALTTSEAKPFFHTEIHSDLEKILIELEKQKKPADTLVDKFFTDKASSLHAKAKRIHREIRVREALDLLILDQIDTKISSINTQMRGLDNIKAYYNPELRREKETTRIQFRNQVFELEREKRREYLECWKDLLFLKREMLPVLEEIFDMFTKRRVLERT